MSFVAKITELSLSILARVYGCCLTRVIIFSFQLELSENLTIAPFQGFLREL